MYWLIFEIKLNKNVFMYGNIFFEFLFVKDFKLIFFIKYLRNCMEWIKVGNLNKK